MSEDIKGVFVRLPLSDKQKMVIWDKCGEDEYDDAILAIGTPIQPCADVEIAAIKALLRPLLTRLDYAAHELEQTEHAQSVHQMAHICLSLLSDEAAIRESAFRELAALNEGAAG